jgi:membrane-bound lytic murein transglycosylase A
VSRRAWAYVAAAIAVVLLAAVVAGYFQRRPPPEPRLTLVPAEYDALVGWQDDRVAAAIPAFLRSCKAILRKPDSEPLDPRTKNSDLGPVGEWRAACIDAAAVPAHDESAARQFFETTFVPFLAGNNGNSDGLFTGYFEITLNGSRQRGGAYQTPLYRRPPDPGRHTRAEIEDGALAGQDLELLWVDDPADAFFLEIQGSGRVRLAEGGVVRVGYAGANGRPYVAVGRLLIERGVLRREQVTMASIRAWMAENPREGAALRRENPSFVFFREVTGEGPLGAQQVALTPERSLAVDRAFLPLGVPLWIDVEQRFDPPDIIRRLVVAQDTGGAIKGPVRGDLFWGYGEAAAAGAGAMNALGRYHVLLPKGVAARLAAGNATAAASRDSPAMTGTGKSH